MSQTIKRIATFMLCALIIISFSLGIVAMVSETATEETFAISEYAQLNDFKLLSLFTRNDVGEIIYPDFIGGIYYNADGSMVLQIVEDAFYRESDLYDQIIGFAAAENLIIEYVKFSYNELNVTMDALNSINLSNNRPAAFANVCSYGTRPSLNRVVVRLIIYSEYEIERFKNTILDSPMISFMESDGSMEYLHITPSHNIMIFISLIILAIAFLSFFQSCYGGVQGILPQCKQQTELLFQMLPLVENKQLLQSSQLKVIDVLLEIVY